MKTFFRFWFRTAPNSHEHCLYIYAENLSEASGKASTRLSRDYSRAILTGRCEEFSLEDSGQFCRSGDICSNLSPDDVLELAADLAAMNPDTFNNPTRRMVEIVFAAEDCIKRNRDPRLLPRRRQLPKQIAGSH